MGPEQGPRPGEENYVADEDEAREMAYAEKPERDNAANYRTWALGIRNFAKGQESAFVRADLDAVAAKWERLAREEDEKAVVEGEKAQQYRESIQQRVDEARQEE